MMHYKARGRFLVHSINCNEVFIQWSSTYSLESRNNFGTNINNSTFAIFQLEVAKKTKKILKQWQLSQTYVKDSTGQKKASGGRNKEGKEQTEYIDSHINHLDEEMRRKEEIQLLDGPELSPFPWLVFASVDNIGFEAFPFTATAGDSEVDGTCGLLKTYKIVTCIKIELKEINHR